MTPVEELTLWSRSHFREALVPAESAPGCVICGDGEWLGDALVGRCSGWPVGVLVLGPLGAGQGQPLPVPC